MAASRRLQKELSDLQNSGLKTVREIQVDEGNLLVWNALIVPSQPPFSNGAFRVELTFPADTLSSRLASPSKPKSTTPTSTRKGRSACPSSAPRTGSPRPASTR
uniref:Ubiquitin-conjugating enzyme E2 L3 n=1 Tax=Lygus hesperus TaxID=30085 RepID=A0A0A9WCJ1_LYGHE